MEYKGIFIFETFIKDCIKILEDFDIVYDERYIFKPITDQDKMQQCQD
ncbi:MAG: hypothetical protein IPN67_19745 [Bacteroidales bacterium]|nr:hypothetical protein [Bacteroidales bacterium]MBK8884501.1 hypothetical protein [Bacteroidales bacterium]